MSVTPFLHSEDFAEAVHKRLRRLPLDWSLACVACSTCSSGGSSFGDPLKRIVHLRARQEEELEEAGGCVGSFFIGQRDAKLP